MGLPSGYIAGRLGHASDKNGQGFYVREKMPGG